MNRCLLVFGASSAIGLALLQQAVSKGWRAVGVSRQTRPESLTEEIVWRQLDYQPDNMTALDVAILEICQDEQPHHIFICHGLLQQQNVAVEKSIRQLDLNAAQHSWWVNYLVPMFHLKGIWPYLLQHRCQVLVLSAKVGSITDNQLGGWYSYRAAKAALNMAVKTAAIELQRLKKPTLLATIHPGTTDTPLAAPFIKNVAPGQLQSASNTAARLWQVIENLQSSDHGALLNWDGQHLPY